MTYLVRIEESELELLESVLSHAAEHGAITEQDERDARLVIERMRTTEDEDEDDVFCPCCCGEE